MSTPNGQDKDFIKFQEEALKETLGNVARWMNKNGYEYNDYYPCGIPLKNGIRFPPLYGKDDVLKANYVHSDIILNGIVACGFAHAKYLVDLYTFLCNKYPYNYQYKINLQKAEIIYDLSILRNSRQIYGPNGVNDYLLSNGLKPHYGGIIPNWTESMRLTIERALSLGINTYEYERTDRDFMEIKHCTDNDFCKAQVDYKEAVDNIIAYVDSNGVMYLVMTIRGYAPSIGGFAFCGGLVDTIGDRALETLDRYQVDLEKAISENVDESIISEKRLLVLNATNRINELSNFQKDQLESTTDAANAELNEEIGVEGNLSIVNIFGKPVYEIITPKMNIPNWDIRGFVPNGMVVTGFIKIYGNLPI
jgi:hypothetical protein